MTYEKAIKKSVLIHQMQAASYHAAYGAHRDSGREYLAILYAGCSAEQYAIARALMRIEEE